MRAFAVLRVWRLRCGWVSGPVRDGDRLAAPAMPSSRALPARPRAAVTASQVYEITDARPSRATGRSK